MPRGPSFLRAISSSVSRSSSRVVGFILRASVLLRRRIRWLFAGAHDLVEIPRQPIFVVGQRAEAVFQILKLADRSWVARYLREFAELI
jgi:hypothetical protein